jgi:hypothetical protein
LRDLCQGPPEGVSKRKSGEMKVGGVYKEGCECTTWVAAARAESRCHQGIRPATVVSSIFATTSPISLAHAIFRVFIQVLFFIALKMESSKVM